MNESKEMQDQRKAARRVAIQEWAKEIRDADMEVGSLHRSCYMDGFDDAWKANQSEMQELKSELASLKSMVEMADEIHFGPETYIWSIQNGEKGSPSEWLAMDQGLTIKKRFDSPTEAFAAINGGKE